MGALGVEGVGVNDDFELDLFESIVVLAEDNLTEDNLDSIGYARALSDVIGETSLQGALVDDFETALECYFDPEAVGRHKLRKIATRVRDGAHRDPALVAIDGGGDESEL